MLNLKKFSKRTLIIAAIVIAVLPVLILWGYFSGKSDKPEYLTAPVTRGTIEENVLATGSLQPFQEVDVGAQVSGQIAKLNIAIGDVVKKGEVLAQIDPRTQRNQLQSAEAALTNDRAALLAKQASLTQAEQELARQKTMFAAGATSKEALQNAQAAYKNAQAGIVQAKVQIEQSQVNVDTAKLNLSYTTVTAPIDGTVIAVPTKEGQTVNAGMSTPTIATIAQLNKMTVKVEISEADVAKVKAGMKAYFTILGNHKHYSAVLRSIDPAPGQISDNQDTNSISDGTAIYYYGALDTDNSDGSLRMYMTANAVISVAKAENVLTFPATALGERSKNGQYVVEVLDKNGKVTERTITTGLGDGVNIEVKSGLSEGETVVIGTDNGNGETRIPGRVGRKMRGM